MLTRSPLLLEAVDARIQQMKRYIATSPSDAPKRQELIHHLMRTKSDPTEIASHTRELIRTKGAATGRQRREIKYRAELKRAQTHAAPHVKALKDHWNDDASWFHKDQQTREDHRRRGDLLAQHVRNLADHHTIAPHELVGPPHPDHEPHQDLQFIAHLHGSHQGLHSAGESHDSHDSMGEADFKSESDADDFHAAIHDRHKNADTSDGYLPSYRARPKRKVYTVNYKIGKRETWDGSG